MSARFVNVDRQTPMLLPVDMREWVRGDDLAHFILEAMEAVESELGVINHRGSGSEQYPPSMMMGLLLYCYSHGIFTSRRIEAATYSHLSVRYLSGDTHPDHDTIATFRRVNRKLVEATFVRVLELAREMGLLRLGTVAVDGSKLWANAAKRRTLSEEQLEAEGKLLEEEVEQLLDKAEQADAQDTETAERLPKELADRAQRQAKLQAARLALSERREQRKRRAAAERQQALREGCEAPPQRPIGRQNVNLTDPQSGLQPTAQGFIQGYNVQAALSTESGLIVAAHVVSDTNDRRQLAPIIAAIPAQLGTPQHIVADTGYDNAAQILYVERTTGATVYCAPQRSRAHQKVPSQRWRRSQRRTVSMRLRAQMAQRLESEQARRLYALRHTTIEPAFGIIKSVLQFRGFHLRGLQKVNIEWHLVSTAFNCRRIAGRMGRR